MRIVLVPGVLALSAEYRSLADPVPELRTSIEAALDWVGPSPRIVGDEHGVIAELVAARAGQDPDLGRDQPGTGPSTGRDSVVIVANGSAKRTAKAPGHLDERARAFDDWLREALTVDPGELARLDHDLAAELWADVDALRTLAELLNGPPPADFAPAETDHGPGRPTVHLIGVDYDDDPFGVKYWVIRWEVE